MNTNTESQKNKRYLEVITWIVVIVLLIVAIVGNYIYRDVMLLLRATVVILLIIIAGIISLMTKQGKSAITFARESKIEMRKVIWPTRQETIHTTLVVIAVTIIMSLILWSLDSILVRLISFLTNLRF